MKKVTLSLDSSLKEIFTYTRHKFNRFRYALLFSLLGK